MAKDYLRKRIYLNTNKTKYCVVKLFADKHKMQEHYKRLSPEDIGHYKCDGASIHYEKFYADTMELSAETGQVLLHFGALGGGVVSHEFMHAVLWAWKHVPNKIQYPIKIESMSEEEEILYNLSFAISSFYKWFYSVEHRFEKSSN